MYVDGRRLCLWPCCQRRQAHLLAHVRECMWHAWGHVYCFLCVHNLVLSLLPPSLPFPSALPLSLLPSACVWTLWHTNHIVPLFKITCHRSPMSKFITTEYIAGACAWSNTIALHIVYLEFFQNSWIFHRIFLLFVVCIYMSRTISHGTKLGKIPPTGWWISHECCHSRCT